MRAATAIALACAFVLAGDLAAQPKPDEAAAPADGFDHLLHDGKVAVAGAEAIECEDCHTIDPNGLVTGRPGHTACFGDCHGDTPQPRRRARALGRERRLVCLQCHAPAPLERLVDGARVRRPVAYPPYENDPDYGLALSHEVHGRATASGSGCRACHAVPGAATPSPATGAPHQRCVGCHLEGEDDAPPMSACTTCHSGAYGPGASPHLEPGVYRVNDTFRHGPHVTRAHGACEGCHRGIVTATGNDLPTPTTDDCAGCHDGEQAFSVAGATCRQCHRQPARYAASETRNPAAPPRFSHQAHAPHLGDRGCDACHELDAGGEPRAPARDHAPCSDSGCHREQFASTDVTICGACHVGAEPWRPLHFDVPRRSTTEFGSRFSHAAHLGGNEPPIDAPCTRCHGDAGASRDMRMPGGHALCAGADCHTTTRDGEDGDARPALGACEGCHRAGLIRDRERARRRSRWSVRAMFRHAPHRRDGDETVACQTCHADVGRARDLASIGVAAKSVCATCHDGRKAFKVTGHACARCHGVPPAAAP